MTWAFTTYCNLGFLSQSSNQSQLTSFPRQSWNCHGISSARPVWEPDPSSRSLQRPFHRLSVPSCWNRGESRLESVDVDAGKVFQSSAPRPAAWHSPCLIWKPSFRQHIPEGYKRAVDKIRGPMAKNGFRAKKRTLLNPNHVLPTTGQSCAKEKVPFSQINISLLADFGCYFGKKRIFGPFSAFWQKVKMPVSP